MRGQILQSAVNWIIWRMASRNPAAAAAAAAAAAITTTTTTTITTPTTTREQSSRGPVDEIHFFKKPCSRLKPKSCNLPHYANTWSSTCHNKPRKLHGFNTLCEHLVSYMSQ